MTSRSLTDRAKSTPTPGPWVPERESGLRWRIRTEGAKGTLAYMTARPAAWAGNFSHAQIEANARLIAAAPDLLSALEELVAIVDDFREGHNEMDSFTTQPARIAIAKARND